MLSIWERTGFHQTPDLIVVGAGIVGLFTALHYKRRFPEHRVTVVERGPYPSGASVKNAGFACFGSPSELLHDIDSEGENSALARVEERWRGLLELRAEIGDDAMGFEGTGGHEIFLHTDPLYARVAARFDELDQALRKIFKKTVFTWKDERISALGLRTDHLAWNALEGSVDSGKLMRSLLAKVQGAGVMVRFNSSVMKWEQVGDGVELTMADGVISRAAQVAICTNGYSKELVPRCDILPARGQVVLTSVIPKLALEGTFHMDEGYYYFREFGGRVLLGGARNLDKAGETTTVDSTTPGIQARLEEVLRETILPGRKFSIDQRWSGVMGFRTHAGPPVVEHLSSNVVLAAGLGGIGVAIGIRVGRKAAELLG